MHLSRRQEEIILLICEGRSNKEIGKKLDVSPRTVESHLQRLYTQHKVHSRTALVVKWLREQSPAEED